MKVSVNRREILVIGAANRWDGMWMADQQLATSLSEFIPVLFVDPVQSIGTRVLERNSHTQRGGRPWLSHLAPGLARLVPEGLPGLSRPAVAALNARLAAAQVRMALSRLGGRAFASIEANVLSPISGRIGEKASVYWAQDDFEAMAGLVGGQAAAYARAEARLAAAADIVIAANPHVAHGLRRQGREALVIPYGCDAQHFAQAAKTVPAHDIRLERPFSVFVGHLGERIDLELLEGIANAGVRLLLVGPLHPNADRARFEALAARPTVQWVGNRSFEDLPAYVGGAEVGLVPYTTSRFNIGSFPLKTLEYLAAGLPVVSTPLPGVEWIGSQDICVAPGRDAFVRAVQRLVMLGRDATGDERRRAFARQHSWGARAIDVAVALGLRPAVQREEGTTK